MIIVPLRERITDLLRDAIVSGEMRPSQPLIETELAAQLGVSRALLRRSPGQMLVQDGLVESVPYKGTIGKLTHTDIIELYSFRNVLEHLRSAAFSARVTCP
ncbi:MAG: GntR family transcriptional regulator [Anaerolineae bacterium]